MASSTDHLSILRVLNLVLGGLQVLATLVIAGLLLAFGLGVGAMMQDSPLPTQAQGMTFGLMGVVGVVITGLSLAFAVLHFVAAGRVRVGRGRVLQTALAVLSLFNIPVGLAYGAYALWVCWFNEPTRAQFDQAEGRPT